MAERSAHDAVDQTQSVGEPSPSDVPATTPINNASRGEGDVEAGTTRKGSEIEPKLFLLEQEDTAMSEQNSAIDGLSSGDLLRPASVNGPGSISQDEHTETYQAALEDSGARSDTDGSRAEGSGADDSKSHGALKPVKKLSTYKATSFAKYTLPKALTTSTAAKVVADKAAPSSAAQSSSFIPIGRPRLVAKSTSGLGEKKKAFKNAAPDPMQVWNKNRVTPQPSTKHLTDEELKQQYGIHMTSRIQGDGDGKEAKWADIDDDEDDWAPETIEWTDGTKTTLNTVEDLTVSSQEVAEVPRPEDTTKQDPPMKILTPQFVSTVGPNATVLKLGANAERQQAQKAAVQQQRGPAEKTSLSSSRTTPAPMPAKSPWASLPPVDKLSPIPVNDQSPMPPPQRYSTNTNYSQGPSTMPAPSPAQEISADDFTRGWRDPARGPPRELYMPNSGRYEAVPEGRRRMSKQDQNFRAPAVLQRPNQGDQHAPAEPSAAFQTHRTSNDVARRRASSTLSGGSGQFARRMSLSKSGDNFTTTADATQARRDSTVIRPDSQDGPPSRLQTPTYQAGRDSPSYGFPARQQSPVEPAASQADMEVERARQKVLMREKIERARKRKVEEEARNEAERKERIRLKLESLGPDPRRESSKAEEPSTTQQPQAIRTSTGISPPKPPVPAATGQPQQYGMMKVHPMDTVKKNHALNVSQAFAPEQSTLVNKVPIVLAEVPRDTASKVPESAPNGIQPINEPSKDRAQEDVGLEDRRSKTAPADPEVRANWRSDHRSPPVANLWGPLNNSNKALGNGTFDQNLAGYAAQDLSSRGSSYSAHGWVNGKTPSSDKSPQPPPDSRAHVAGSFASPDQQSLAINSEVDVPYPVSRPAPIGPPSAHGGNQSWQHSPNLNSAPAGVAAWNNFHGMAGPHERAENERAQRELAAKKEEETRSGVRTAPQYTFNETWKQVQLGDQAGQRQVSSVAHSAVPPAQIFGAVGSVQGPDIAGRSANGLAPRGSRFFPQFADNQPTYGRRAVTYGHPEAPHSPSPPPAEEYASQHPAYEGDLQNPVVHLPREKAVVKLPPQTQNEASLPQQTHMSWAARVQQSPQQPPLTSQPSLRTVSTPLAQTTTWQERFNGLLGRQTSPGKKPAVLAVTSSTREVLDVLPTSFTASVQLPQQSEVDILKDAGKVTSKDVEDEEEMFEDREAGSLPLVKVPPIIFGNEWQPALFPVHKPLPLSEHAFTTPLFPIDGSSENLKNHPRDVVVAHIRMPGMERPLKRTIQRKGRVVSGPRHVPKSRNTSVTFPKASPKTKGQKSRQVSDTRAPPPTAQPNGGGASQAKSPKMNGNPSPLPRPTAPTPNSAANGSRITGDGSPRHSSNSHHHSRGWKGRHPHTAPGQNQSHAQPAH